MSGGAGAADAVVVGGGVSGIAAALDLADAGRSVVLVERRRRLGGLTRSFERGGLWFDNGQHVFLRCCDAYRSFLQRIGASGDVVLQDRLSVPVLRPGGRSATIGRSGLPAPLHLAGAVARYSHLPVGDRLRLGPAIAALRRLDPDDPALDGETFGHWLARHRQRRRAVEVLWDLITLPTVNLPAAEASLAMGVKVFRTGLLDRNDGADIGWSAVPLGQLHGARAAAALAAAGVEVVTGASVAELLPASGGWRVVLDDAAGGGTASAGPGTGSTSGSGSISGPGSISGRGSNSGPGNTRAPGTAAHRRAIEAAGVVLAVPPAVAAGLAPSGTLGPVERLGAAAVVDVQLVLDRRVTDLPFFAAVDSPVQFVFDRTTAAGLDPGRGQVLALSLSGADALVAVRPADLVARFSAALGTLLPGMARARVVDAVVTKEQAATFRAVPGSGALRPPPGHLAPGLAVAGAWCATGWPATMEGAVRSGRAAAVALLADDTGPRRTGAASPTATRTADPAAAEVAAAEAAALLSPATAPAEAPGTAPATIVPWYGNRLGAVPVPQEAP